MVRTKAIVLLCPLILGGCGEHELIQAKNKEIDTLKTQKITLTAELETMRESFQDCQKKNQDAQHKIQEFNQTIEELKAKESLPHDTKKP